jgi:hypothetical protein
VLSVEKGRSGSARDLAIHIPTLRDPSSPETHQAYPGHGRQLYSGACGVLGGWQANSLFLAGAPPVPKTKRTEPSTSSDILAMDSNEPARPAKRKRLNFACNYCKLILDISSVSHGLPVSSNLA